MRSVWILLAFLGVLSVAFVAMRRRAGRVRVMERDRDVRFPREQGQSWGARATFVQFSTDTCSVCPPTASLLRRVAESVPGVRHIEIDAIERMDLVRRFAIRRSPTVLVLDSDGVVTAKISGAVSESSAREAIDLIPPTVEYTI